MPGTRALLLLIVLSLALSPASAAAQHEAADPAAAETSEADAAPTSAIKKIAISVSGGRYSGATFFELPIQNERAAVEQGSHNVTLFTGEEMELADGLTPNRFDAPQKKIESGQFFEGRIGFYLDDNFHIDLMGALARSEASLSLAEIEEWEVLGRVSGTEAEGFRDNSFASYMGGFQLGFDGHTLKQYGVTPNFGIGLGGIINRFTTLEDKTALFFQLYGELSVPLKGEIMARGRVTATTYSFQTEELEYGKQVTTTSLTFGLTWLFDTNPIYAGR